METGFPDARTVRLRNATLPRAVLSMPWPGEGPLVAADVWLEDGRIAAITPRGSPPRAGAEVTFDCRDGLVLPAFADIHTHLDKGHIWPRRPNPDGTFMAALDAVAADRAAHWSATDIERRMEFALRCAYAHGSAAVRTHLDSNEDTLAWDVFDVVRERWAGRMELQAVALLGPEALLDEGLLRARAARARASGGRLGGAIAVHPEVRAAMRRVVAVAGEFGLALDLHVDETLDRDSSALRHLADAVLETGFDGEVLAGHCCVLAAQDERTARSTIARVAEAGMAVVSLPMCNLYLQDRRSAPVTPRQRGVTLVKEFRAAGVRVALASDNTRDPFYAYGDLDGFEVLREGVRIAHLDHPQAEAWDWLRAITSEAAGIAGFSHKGQLGPGLPADLVLVGARDWTELLARPQADRIVVRAGRAVDTRLPDYRELDELMR